MPRFSMRCASDCPSGPPLCRLRTTSPMSRTPASSIRWRKWLYSPRSASGSSRSTAAWAARGIVAKRMRRGSAAVLSAPSTWMSDLPSRWAASSGASGRASPSRTKSALGSRTTMRSPVPSRSCSRMTPSAKVLPEPLWPHRNVCRPKPSARSRAATSAPDGLHVPMGNLALLECCRASSCPRRGRVHRCRLEGPATTRFGTPSASSSPMSDANSPARSRQAAPGPARGTRRCRRPEARRGHRAAASSPGRGRR